MARLRRERMPPRTTAHLYEDSTTTIMVTERTAKEDQRRASVTVYPVMVHCNPSNRACTSFLTAGNAMLMTVTSSDAMADPRTAANENRLQEAVLSDRSRKLIQGRAVISQAAVPAFASLGDAVDPDKGYAKIRRQRCCGTRVWLKGGS